MLRIKKLDIFILKSFLTLFAGTFVICLFIFMMQFLWRYIDELVGKGLGLTVLGQFFFYSAITLIPMSLPLSILLAALMTFGNFGERYELLAMKSAGIPLTRIMRPVVACCAFLCLMSFFFQNVISPKAQKMLWTLVVSVRQTSPELDIPEGVFYSEIEGYNIYVKHKNKETGMMTDILIYNLSEGFENAHVIWAEKGKIETTQDQQHLLLHLYNGEQFENLKSQNIARDNVPYRRESFREKQIVIDFNGGFEMIDGSYLDSRSDAKNMAEISHSIDSLKAKADSIGRNMYADIARTYYRRVTLTSSDSAKLSQNKTLKLDADSLFESYTLVEKERVLSAATNQLTALTLDWQMKSIMSDDLDRDIRRHQLDWHRKITLSLACLIFFFIGAPLGAIIRKGGLGMPVVVSVFIFVIYYIIDTGSTRIARSGEMNMIVGVWMSTFVLAPVGTFFTYKSNNDSVVFNIEIYVNFFRTLIGMRQTRHIYRKEVIIEDPNYPRIYAELDELSAACTAYKTEHRLGKAPNYYHIFTNSGHDDQIARIGEKMEELIEELSNGKDKYLFELLNRYPVLSTNAHKSPFLRKTLNVLAGLVVPIGIVFYFRIWIFGMRLDQDLKRIVANDRDIRCRLEEETFIK